MVHVRESAVTFILSISLNLRAEMKSSLTPNSGDVVGRWESGAGRKA